jgi:alkaline phosphatase D
MKNIFLLLALVCAAGLVHAQPGSGMRSSVNPQLAPFYHGVASGDPLSDRVILWTRITTADPTATVEWEMALDTNFTLLVQSGIVTTDQSKDYCVKTDVSGLQAGTWYYYRFRHQGVNSMIGRTRTTPSGSINELRLAVVSCSNLPVGYFNAYRDIARRNEVDAVVHLGDYIYEYGSTSSIDTSRSADPPVEITSLADYRMRHSQYKLDPDLRYCHQQYPFITVWDDHETTNNSWRDGAENHTDGAEGNWQDRKSFGRRAYFEWMPIREQQAGNDSIIRRTIRWGNLVDLIMVDTRLEGRDEQVGATSAAVNDTNRTLLGADQRQWLLSELSNSPSTWKVMGNQVMVAPLTIFGTPVNADQWDGYTADRRRVYDHILNNNISNFVVFTGDIHSAWSNDLPNGSAYNSSTGAGSVGVEFVCSSVTSGGAPSVPQNIIQSANPHIKFVELGKRGYTLVDFNAQRVQGDHIFVSTITNRNFTTEVGASWLSAAGTRFLSRASGAIPARSGMPYQAPPLDEPSIPNSTGRTDEMVVLQCFPNPFEQNLGVQLYLEKPESISWQLLALDGRMIRSGNIPAAEPGLNSWLVPVGELAAGQYTFSLRTSTQQAYSKLIKTK